MGPSARKGQDTTSMSLVYIILGIILFAILLWLFAGKIAGGILGS